MKVSQRRGRGASEKQLTHGVPLFLDQLKRTLEAERSNNLEESLAISGAPGADGQGLSELGITATTHGRELLLLGYSVDQVVHDYSLASSALEMGNMTLGGATGGVLKRSLSALTTCWTARSPMCV